VDEDRVVVVVLGLHRAQRALRVADLDRVAVQDGAVACLELAPQLVEGKVQSRLYAGENGFTETNHPLLEAARTVALGQVRPDRRSVLFRPTFEDAVSEALVAIVAGEDPVPALRRYLTAERAWLMRTAPLLDTLQLRPAA
jgi:hypothetical protein